MGLWRATGRAGPGIVRRNRISVGEYLAAHRNTVVNDRTDPESPAAGTDVSGIANCSHINTVSGVPKIVMR